MYSVVPSPTGQREKKAMADPEYEVSLAKTFTSWNTGKRKTKRGGGVANLNGKKGDHIYYPYSMNYIIENLVFRML